ncbi:hypothetical protein IT568_10920 [bacterium]|nr:hypothetical protein [bacterium]
MKAQKNLALNLLLTSLAIAFYGCSDDSVGTTSTENQIQGVVETNTDTFEEEGINDDGMQEVSYNNFDSTAPAPTDQPAFPYRFGRKITEREKYFTFSIDGTTATSTITKELKGTLKVGNSNGFLFEKTFEHTIKRNVDFAGTTNSNGELVWKWENTYVATGFSSDATTPTNTFDIQSVTFLVNGTNLITVDSPETFVIKKDTIPVFHKDDLVKVFATVNSSEELVGLLHYGVNHKEHHLARRMLHDDGIAPDVTANDGVYSGEWNARQKVGVHHVVVDFMSKATIENETAAYNSVSWGFPYKIATN